MTISRLLDTTPPKDPCPRSSAAKRLTLSREDRGSKPLFQRRRLPSTQHCGGQRVILATVSTHSRGDGMVLHLADKTSANTTSPANSMLATSVNVACSGCAWKWWPRSVLQCIGVRMAASSWPTQSYTQERRAPVPSAFFPRTQNPRPKSPDKSVSAIGGRGAPALRGSSPDHFTGSQPSGSISNASVSR
jgi:hypothetical protein